MQYNYNYKIYIILQQKCIYSNYFEIKNILEWYIKYLLNSEEIISFWKLFKFTFFTFNIKSNAKIRR